MTTEKKISLEKVEWWVRIYSYITIGALIYGVAAAHIPFFIGIPWSSCEVCGSNLACVLVFHFYEVPLVSFNAFFAWYGLKRFSPGTSYNYSSLLTFAVVANVVFFTFEIGLLLDGLRREAPLWETIALSSIALILISGAGLGVYVKQKLITYQYQLSQSQGD